MLPGLSLVLSLVKSSSPLPSRSKQGSMGASHMPFLPLPTSTQLAPVVFPVLKSMAAFREDSRVRPLGLLEIGSSLDASRPLPNPGIRAPRPRLQPQPGGSWHCTHLTRKSNDKTTRWRCSHSIASPSPPSPLPAPNINSIASREGSRVVVFFPQLSAAKACSDFRILL